MISAKCSVHMLFEELFPLSAEFCKQHVTQDEILCVESLGGGDKLCGLWPEFPHWQSGMRSGIAVVEEPISAAPFPKNYL